VRLRGELARKGPIPLGGAVEKGEAAVQSHHPCCWHQSALAFVGTGHPPLRSECAQDRPRTRLQVDRLSADWSGNRGYPSEKVAKLMEDEAGKAGYNGEVRTLRFLTGRH
jgi:hypothetical protein